MWRSETDWLRSENPHYLLHLLERQQITSRRKLRLAAVACCRLIWDDSTEWEREVVETAERYADHQVQYHELLHAARTVRETGTTQRRRAAKAAVNTTHREARLAVGQVVYTLLSCAWGGPYLPEHPLPEFWAEGSRSFSCFIRDIFGYPFRPVDLDPACLSWKGGTIPKLAQATYDERAFDILPVLADALEEAGCANADTLAHCRDPGPHVRGCWVVDLLLGKK